MNINNQSQHDWNLNRIYKASKTDQLYLLEFKDDKVQSKTGWGFIKATLKHVFYAVTSWSGAKNRAEENKQIAHLFKQNTALLSPGKEIKNLILVSPPNTEKIERRVKTLGSHAEFVKRFGEVPVVDGKAIPTLDQLRGAFLLGSQLARYYDMSTNKTRAPYARAIQEIMVGEAVRNIPMPEDDLCFTCQELQKFDTVSPLKMPDGKRVVHNPYTWLIETTGVYTANRTDDGRKQACDQCINAFIDDLFRTDHFVISGRKHELEGNALEERLGIFREIKQDFVAKLNPEFIRGAENYNAGLPAIFGYSEGVMYDKLEAACRREVGKREEVGDDFTDRLLENFNFTEEELAPLVQHFDGNEEEAKERLNTLLKFHMLKVALLVNQRSSAPEQGSAFIPFNDKMAEHNLYATQNYGKHIIEPDSYAGTTLYRYNLVEQNDLLVGVEIGFKMPSLSVNAPCEVIELRNVVVSPLAVDYLDRIISA